MRLRKSFKATWSSTMWKMLYELEHQKYCLYLSKVCFINILSFLFSDSYHLFFSDRQVGDDTSQLLQDEYDQNFEFHVEEDVSHDKLTCFLHIKPRIKANIPLTNEIVFCRPRKFNTQFQTVSLLLSILLSQVLNYLNLL